MKMKIEWKVFLITDFEKEEVYLTEMHRNGWKFVKLRFGMFYYFEAVEPEEVTYKLDFVKLEKAERESYLQMYMDYGWANVARCRNFWIFRKKVNQAEDTEIFSDKASKLAMIERIYKTRVSLGLLLYMIIFIAEKEPVFRVVYSLVYLPLMVYVLYRFHQLRKSLKED